MMKCTDQIKQLGIAIPWPLQDYIEVAASPGAVTRARLHARKTLAEWRVNGQAAEAIELVVSEMVTNAILHGGPAQGMPVARLWLSTNGKLVLVQVWDRATQMPALRAVQGCEESGRGLVLVDAVSESWGAYRPVRLSGKVVWSLLSTNP
jgi:anti-sigma regulatory factor (Ser/Thr protein kinase)